MNGDYESRCVGTLLGMAAGDILGAGVEGYTREALLMEHGELRDFLHSTRGYGQYTDDTEMALALAQSLLDCKGINAQHCSKTYAAFYNPRRGYGGGAHKVLAALQQGADYLETGYLSFKDGSFANGGAMRIAPIGLVYRDAEDDVLKKAVFDAVRCTHVHPEGVDGAVVQAKATALLAQLTGPEYFQPTAFLETLSHIATTTVFRDNISYLQSVINNHISDVMAVKQLGNGIRASEAVSCALLAAVRHYSMPEEAVIKSVNFGGDTDTIGAMTGALMGAMHGMHWLPKRWLDNIETGERGKDYIIQLARNLSTIGI